MDMDRYIEEAREILSAWPDPSALGTGYETLDNMRLQRDPDPTDYEISEPLDPKES